MTTKVKRARGWVDGYSDEEYEKSFGPITARVRRDWPFNERAPTAYHCHLYAGTTPLTDAPIIATIEEIGVPYCMDRCGAAACRLIERKVKRLIRSWAK